MIDYRSDTVTKPTPAMRAAMFEAPLGDDVFGEDPTIHRLESQAAALFGMEAALFCPSGTMTNQIAIKCHTQPGDEVICDHLSHIYLYEGGGIAFNAGCSVKLVPGNHGRIDASQVKESIHPPGDVHKPLSALVSLENTANRGGGSCYNFSAIEQIQTVCQAHGLPLHLDGARLFNALVAKGETPQQYGRVFNSISICLSKGLGAPVGSLLIGTRAFIHKARRIRKVFGGGMRQAGMLAAAGIYALDHHVERLAEDHTHAAQLAAALAAKDFTGTLLPVETNILIFEVKGRFTAASLTAAFREKGILVMAISPTQVRMVTHLDVLPGQVAETIQHIHEL